MALDTHTHVSHSMHLRRYTQISLRLPAGAPLCSPHGGLPEAAPSPGRPSVHASAQLPPLVLRFSGSPLSLPSRLLLSRAQAGPCPDAGPDVYVLPVLAAWCPHRGSATSLPSLCLGTLCGLTGVHRHLQPSPPGAKLRSDPPAAAQGAHSSRGAWGLGVSARAISTGPPPSAGRELSWPWAIPKTKASAHPLSATTRKSRHR